MNPSSIGFGEKFGSDERRNQAAIGQVETRSQWGQ
jgi:hypothetical protein